MRRFLQFRLRTALLLMTICAVLCFWLSANLRQWQAERGVLVAIGPATLEDPRQLVFSLL